MAGVWDGRQLGRGQGLLAWIRRQRGVVHGVAVARQRQSVVRLMRRSARYCGHRHDVQDIGTTDEENEFPRRTPMKTLPWTEAVVLLSKLHMRISA